LTTAAREYVAIDGCRLEYRWLRAAAREAPTIVFLHEGLGSIAQWRDFPAELCARTGCGGLIYNRQGYGGSDPFEQLPPTFMHREALDVLPRVLDAFEIARPVLFGHSDGGSIALLYAASGQTPPAALVLEAPHVFVEDLTVASIAALRETPRLSKLREGLARHHGAHVDRLLDGWIGTWLSAKFRTWNITDVLSNIACPILVIQGRDDEYGTMAQVSAIANAASGPVETLALSECGHAPHVDQREAVLQASIAFLQQRSGKAFTIGQNNESR
jgi:pimeloyl-ACP methyl ester carboxylesterase